MTRSEALRQAREILTANKIEDASLESELLLRHGLKIERVPFYLDLDGELSPEEEETFWKLIHRRLKGEPTAYIIGRREFYGLDFYVDPCVLIPRPESELLVEKALSLARQRPITKVADIGTGCGTIAITLALNLPQAKIYATDISADALEVAKINCAKHGVTDRVCFLRGNLLDPLPEPVDLIVANPPYVKKSDLPKSGPVSFEPRLALDGGREGLDKIHQLCLQVDGKLCPQGSLLLEIGLGQGKAVTILLRNLFPSAWIEFSPDLSGIERVVSLCLTER